MSPQRSAFASFRLPRLIPWLALFALYANDAPRAQAEADAPGRTLPEVLADVEVRLTGRVKALYSFDDFQGPGSADYLTYVAAESPGEVNFNPRDTRIGFRAYQSWDDWKAQAVFEMDFRGDNAGNNFLPRLRHGYVQLDQEDEWQLLVGQTWNPIARQYPPMIDMGIMIYGGNAALRLPQVRITKDLGPDWSVELSAFKHRVSNDQQTEERMPWFAVRGVHRGFLAGKGELAVAFGGREVEVGGVDYSPWIATLEFALPLCADLSLNGEVWTGAGIGAEFVRNGLDYGRTTGTAIRSSGGFVAGKYRCSKALAFAAGFGIDDPEDGDVGPSTTFRRNLHAFTNVTYEIGPRIVCGLELNRLQTEDVTGRTLDGTRVQLGLWFDF